MDLPSSFLDHQQQRWTPNNMIQPNVGRTNAYVGNDHCYNNLGFNLATRSDQYRYNNQNFNVNNTTEFMVATSPTNKKALQQINSLWLQSSNLVSIKSKIGVEYRRYAVCRDNIAKFDDFFAKIQSMHHLQGTEFAIYYLDQDGEMLPINNDDNLARAIDATNRLKSTQYITHDYNGTQLNYISHQQHNQRYSPYQMKPQQILPERPYLKLFLDKKGGFNELFYSPNFTLKCKRKDNLINLLIPSSSSSSSDSRPRISMPEDFRQVSSIIDADILPATRRRVLIKRGSSDKPLGFFIRDGTYHKMNAQGVIEKNYGFFISKLVPGGLAESTNLLAANDEILEVNGIAVDKSKGLEQVRDMMIANSSNLIITTRPAKPYSQHDVNYNSRIRNRNNIAGRDRLASTQSTSSDIGEDFIRHHIH